MILILFRSVIRDDYPRKWGFLLEILSIFIMLFVFWFTSKAFKPNSLVGENYFYYLLIGEILLFLPLSLMQQNIRLGKKIGIRGTFDFLLTKKISISKYFFSFTMVYFFKDLLKTICLLTLSAAIFYLPLNLNQLLSLFIYLLLGCLIFSFLGMIIGLSLIFWGRGEAIWGQTLSILSILGGAYFPLNVFPNWLNITMIQLNPIAVYLELGREIARHDLFIVLDQYPLSMALLSWLLVAFLLYKQVYYFGLKYYKRNGPPSEITI